MTSARCCPRAGVPSISRSSLHATIPSGEVVSSSITCTGVGDGERWTATGVHTPGTPSTRASSTVLATTRRVALRDRRDRQLQAGACDRHREIALDALRSLNEPCGTAFCTDADRMGSTRQRRRSADPAGRRSRRTADIGSMTREFDAPGSEPDQHSAATQRTAVPPRVRL